MHHAGAFVVVLGADRRESGTHYTPKSLTEKIVEETLTPIVYRGPTEGAAREDWKLKSADELLDLKVCDPAMGSGAFLVQACRWLADRLVKAWSDLEAAGGRIDDEGNIHTAEEARAFEPLSRDTEERAESGASPHRRALPLWRRQEPARGRTREAVTLVDHPCQGTALRLSRPQSPEWRQPSRHP